MTRTEINQSTRTRILKSVQDRLSVEVRDLAHRSPTEPPSRPRIAGKNKRPGRRKGQSYSALAAAKLVLLALVVVLGVAAIIWLRTLAEAFGINWVGE